MRQLMDAQTRMGERDIVKGLVEFAFLAKAQLFSEETALLRALLNIAIMEAEDALEAMDDAAANAPERDAPRRAGSSHP
jgi:hypothetical protein